MIVWKFYDKKKSFQKCTILKYQYTYFCSDFVFSSSILIHLFNFDIRLCSLLAPGELKSKSLANCVFSLWKAGSWAAAWARLASVSCERAPPTFPVDTRPLCSRPMPKVLTSLCTNCIISGEIRALVTVGMSVVCVCAHASNEG